MSLKGTEWIPVINECLRDYGRLIKRPTCEGSEDNSVLENFGNVKKCIFCINVDVPEDGLVTPCFNCPLFRSKSSKRGLHFHGCMGIANYVEVSNVLIKMRRNYAYDKEEASKTFAIRRKALRIRLKENGFTFRGNTYTCIGYNKEEVK